ncbi:unnamed protein product [Danaus chrysippus]|uniref:nicotinamidase n=1 Tax=Danaus chrysippus TaxID=151541 RepID=A0A8J2VTD5_9NEOP|nr:unnamed protein product [Danaus chrysippus]
MLDCFIKERGLSWRLSPLYSTMSEVANEFPVEDSCLIDIDACYQTFDKDGDGQLNLEEFRLICKALFRNDKGHIYPVSEERLRHMFQVFDRNRDGAIDREEFAFCWNHWIKVIVRPTSAFLIVDVQNDFICGPINSQCAQSDGSEVVEPINNLLSTVPFNYVFYSLDWHPPDHVSYIDNVHMRELHPSSPVTADKAQTYDTVVFAGNPPMKQRLWPRHCVQDTWGAELYKDLKVVEGAVMVYKGTNPEVDSYSAFFDNNKLSETTLRTELKERNVTDIYICGLAYDVCVGATIADALALGYRSILVNDASRGVKLCDIERTKENIVSNNGVVVDSHQVLSMVEGRDRRPELGYKLAMQLKTALEEEK